MYEEMGKDDAGRQTQYQKIVIDELIFSNRLKPVWGSQEQRYNERNKLHKYLKENRPLCPEFLTIVSCNKDCFPFDEFHSLRAGWLHSYTPRNDSEWFRLNIYYRMARL